MKVIISCSPTVQYIGKGRLRVVLFLPAISVCIPITMFTIKEFMTHKETTPDMSQLTL